MIRSITIAAAAMLWFATTAAAQHGEQPARSFEELKSRVTIGETISVVDTSARVVAGRIATFSDAALMLAVDGSRRQFAVADIARIERRPRDPVANGLLIGAGAGAVVGYGLGRGVDSPSCPREGIECGQGATLGTVTGALWGAVGGWLVDTLIRKREVVYLKP